MKEELILLLDRELPELNGSKRDELAAKIVEIVRKKRRR